MYKRRICPICNGKVTSEAIVKQDRNTGLVSTVYKAACDKCSTNVISPYVEAISLFPECEAKQAKSEEVAFTTEEVEDFFKDWTSFTYEKPKEQSYIQAVYGLNDRSNSSFCGCLKHNA
jgi:hypothetical protein